MKMEGVSDLVNGRNDAPKPAQPSPKEIGREFVRQYYTMLSERPQDVFRFYSHESYFVHDSEQPVQGQLKIQKAIERLAFVDCKARIYTVSGTATMNNGLVIQVCGELSVGDNPGRRFLQTFILCPQTPKKYYVHNDVFQWLDRAFGDPIPQPAQPVDSHVSTTTVESDVSSAVNGDQAPIANGQQQTAPVPDAPHHSSDAASEEAALSEEVPALAEHTNPAEVDGKREQSEAPPNATEDHVEENSHAVSEQVPEQTTVTVVPDNTPKTWAKLVGGCAASGPPQNTQPSNRSNVTTAQTNTRPSLSAQPLSSVSAPPPPVTAGNVHSNTDNDPFTTNNYANSRFAGDDGCKLYIGGITRHLNPESVAIAEKDIRQAFEKFGPVASVNVPRRVLEAGDSAQRSVYAFIVMKSLEGARNAFGFARKDRGTFYLQLKLDSFGFDGEVTLSEQKGSQTTRGAGMAYAHRGGATMQGSSRGSFGMRGGPGGRGGGGMRGGLHQRQFGASSEFRHSGTGGIHAQHA